MSELIRICFTRASICRVRRFFACACPVSWALLSLVFLSVQSSLSAAEEEQEFRILTVVGSATGLQYEPSRSGDPISISASNSPYRSYPVPRDGKLEIFREIPVPEGAPPGTEPIRQVVATGTIPSSSQRSLVILGVTRSGAYDLAVLPDDPALHPPGQIRMVNLSEMRSAVALNKERYLLGPGDSELVDWGSGGILIQIAAEKHGEWDVAFRKERIAQPSARAYCLIFDYIPDPSMDEDPTNPPPATIRMFTENVRVSD